MENNIKNKVLVLDYAKWRCGGDKDMDTEANLPNKLGEGDTQLLNNEGYQCCLGQFSLQLDPQLRTYDILNEAFPSDLARDINLLTYSYEDTEWERDYEKEIISYANTDISNKAASINDEETTTPEEKIEMLKKLFGEEGWKIQVINKN